MSLPGFFNSMAAKLTVILVIFFAVPLFLYGQFKQSDDERRQLLLNLVQEQGILISQTIAPLIAEVSSSDIPAVNEALSQLSLGDLRIRVLLRPEGDSDGGFYVVATAPALPAGFLDQERAELVTSGVLAKLQDSCDGGKGLAVRYVNPAGEEEILTSITPINAQSGCWALITSRSVGGLLGTSISAPYWKSPEIQAALAVYLLMALLVVTLFLGIWRSLGRFTRVARNIRANRGGDATSFAALNRVPELDPVAEEFDRLVGSLRQSAKSMRDAAEENVHAFKTPISVIRQCLEPLNRLIASDETRGRRALDSIGMALSRLDTLVSAARHLEESTADLINPPSESVDFSALVDRVTDDYRGSAQVSGINIVPRIESNLSIRGGTDLVEIIIENLLENAIGFSPKGGEIIVSARRIDRQIALVIADEGPGIRPELAEKIFERYFSFRPIAEKGESAGSDGAGMNGSRAHAAMLPGAGLEDSEDGDAAEHYGIGLWLVRRNVEALGGRVRAANRADRSGLAIQIDLPLAR